VGTLTIFLLLSLRVVVHNFNVLRPPLRPAETDAKLIVDADAMLALPISLERLKAVAWRNAEILKHFCVI
jgi:hypothetical protein